MDSASHEKSSLGARSLLYPEPVTLIATYDKEGNPNVMTVAWAGVCSNDPPSVTVCIRPSRWTYEALIFRKSFTVCVPTTSQVVEADYIGMVSGRNHNKFAEAGFTAVRSEYVDAPYIAECPLVLECSMLDTVELKGHAVIIGEVKDLKVNKNCLDSGGTFPDMLKVSPLIYDDGSKSYFSVGGFVGKAFSAGKAVLGNK